MSIANKTLRFLNEVKAEIYKITWPGQDDLIGTIIIVCLLTLVFSALLGGFDVIFSLLLRKII